MAKFVPRWATLGDFGLMLPHVGGRMPTKSARMSQHRRQGANLRGFQGSAGLPDGKHTLALALSGAPGLGGVARNPSVSLPED